MEKFEHLKSGKIYTKIGEVIDATNGCEGVEMVIYENDEGLKFVREKEEFHQKFKEVQYISKEKLKDVKD